MNTAANLLVILIFLAAFYAFLGLLCGIAEKVRELGARTHQRRRVRRSPRRRTPRRVTGTIGSGARAPRPPRVTVREKAASTRRSIPSAASTGYP